MKKIFNFPTILMMLIEVSLLIAAIWLRDYYSAAWIVLCGSWLFYCRFLEEEIKRYWHLLQESKIRENIAVRVLQEKRREK